MTKTIGYSEFIRLFNIEEPKDFLLPGIELKIDGVWVVVPDEDVFLAPAERACITSHPHNDLTIPALPFPCTLKQLDSFLLFYGLDPNKCLTPEERAEFGDYSLDSPQNKVRKIASSLWKKHPTLRKKYLMEHPEIKKVSETYPGKNTVSGWIGPAPDTVPNGRISGEEEKEQKEICLKAGIPWSETGP